MSKALMRIENAILGQIIRDLTDEAYSLAIEEADGPAMRINAMQDGQTVGWVLFIWGNGGDCLSDFTTNLEKTLKPSIELQNFLAD